MAGNKQHILPRFLLKGFASRIDGEKKYTWVYPRNSPPVEANIRKVCVEKHFYGKQGELSVDADITKFENEYAPFLHELRSSSAKNEIFDPRFANLITHIVTRTKHIRDSFRESAEFLFIEISKYFLNFDNVKAAILNNPEIMRYYIEEKLDNSLFSHIEKDTLRQLIPLIYPAFLDTQKVEMRQEVIDYVKKNLKIAPKATREGHIKGLSGSLTPDKRVEDYNRLHYFICSFDEPLILGDMGCIFDTISKGKRKFKSLDLEDDKVINLFLPISDSQILIGSMHTGIPQINVKLLKEEIAKCSREFFICSQISHDIVCLVPLIGSDTGIISKEEVKQLAEETTSTIGK